MDTVDIKLTKDEALVLFELLARYSESDTLSVNDTAEQQILWKLNNLLEKTLSEPFSQNWAAILEAAKSRLRGES
jgi:hypothetical protein